MADQGDGGNTLLLCPYCGTGVKAGTSNCEGCWRPLPIGSDLVAPSRGSLERRYCPSCGVEVKRGGSTCQGCWQPLPLGADLSAPPIGKPPQASVTTARTETPYESSRNDPAQIFTSTAPTGKRSAAARLTETRETAAPAKRKRGKKKILVTSCALVLIVGGLIVGLAATHRTTTTTTNEPTSCSVKSYSNCAPPGSSKSFADGYDSMTRICTNPNAGFKSCSAYAAAAGSYVNGYCPQIEEDPPIYGGPQPGDNVAEWFAGCQTALGITGGAGNSGSTAAGNSGNT